MKAFHQRILSAVAVLIPSAFLFFYAKDYSAASGTKVYPRLLTVDVFDSYANYQGIQSGWFAQLVLDKFNMKLNIIAPNIAGGGDTMYQTRVAAGELGDLIICSGSNHNLQDLVTAGLVMDMSALLEDQDIMQYELAIALSTARSRIPGSMPSPPRSPFETVWNTVRMKNLHTAPVCVMTYILLSALPE